MIMISPSTFLFSIEVFGQAGRRPWTASSRRLHEIQEKGRKDDVPAEGMRRCQRSAQSISSTG
jgi:hypothetical protein